MLCRAWRQAVALILALACACGWSGALQAVAWAGMATARAWERGWSATITGILRGEDPCRLCRAADSLRRWEDAGQRPAVPASVLAKLGKMEALAGTVPRPVLTVEPALRLPPVPARLGEVSQLRDPPDPPPPRAG